MSNARPSCEVAVGQGTVRMWYPSGTPRKTVSFGRCVSCSRYASTAGLPRPAGRSWRWSSFSTVAPRRFHETKRHVEERGYVGAGSVEVPPSPAWGGAAKGGGPASQAGGGAASSSSERSGQVVGRRASQLGKWRQRRGMPSASKSMRCPRGLVQARGRRSARSPRGTMVVSVRAASDCREQRLSA